MTEFAFASHLEVAPGRFRERLGLDFEEFAVGQRFKHRPGLTISQQDNVEEALDTLNQAMVHYDAHYAARTEWGRPLVVSTLTIQRLVGMTSKTFGRRTRIVGFADIALTHPVFAGDTLYAETEVRAVHAERRRLELQTLGVNQDGTTVCELAWEVEFEPRAARESS